MYYVCLCPFMDQLFLTCPQLVINHPCGRDRLLQQPQTLTESSRLHLSICMFDHGGPKMWDYTRKHGTLNMEKVPERTLKWFESYPFFRHIRMLFYTLISISLSSLYPSHAINAPTGTTIWFSTLYWASSGASHHQQTFYLPNTHHVRIHVASP